MHRQIEKTVFDIAAIIFCESHVAGFTPEDPGTTGKLYCPAPNDLHRVEKKELSTARL